MQNRSLKPFALLVAYAGLLLALASCDGPKALEAAAGGPSDPAGEGVDLVSAPLSAPQAGTQEASAATFIEGRKAAGTVSVPYDGPMADPRYVVVASDGLVLRAGPTKSAERLGLLRVGTRALFLERTPQAEAIDAGADGDLLAPWYRIRTEDGAEGWCYGGFLAVHPYLDLIGRWSAPDASMHGVDYAVEFYPSDGGLRAAWDSHRDERFLAGDYLDDILPWGAASPPQLRASGVNLAIYPEAEVNRAFTMTLVASNESWTLADEPQRLNFWAGAWKEPSYNPARLDKDGYAPVHRAAMALDYDALERELAYGGVANLRGGRRGYPPLTLLLRSDRGVPSLEGVRALLRAGANPNVSDDNDQTPYLEAVDMAAGRGDETLYAIVKALLEAGAEADAVSEDRWAPAIAADAGDKTLLSMMAAHGLRRGSAGIESTVAEYLERIGAEELLELLED